MKDPGHTPFTINLLQLEGKRVHSWVNPNTQTETPDPKETHKLKKKTSLSDQGAGGGGLVSPGGREDTDGLVVAGQTVDTGLDQNQAELGVLVLAVTLKVLADGDSLERISKNARKKIFFMGMEITFLIRK